MTELRPAKMRAAQHDAYGAPDVLQVRSIDRPEVKPGYALVRVAATSINGADVSIRAGRLRLITGKRFPRGTGFDFAGDIVALLGDSALHEGDAVWGFSSDIKQAISAAAADYYLAPLTSLTLRPKSLDAFEAAAFPGAGGAGLGVLRDVARVRPGERVLIRGASGGVGVFAVQIAKTMGAHVTALVNANQRDRVRALGADEALDYRATDPSTLGAFDVIIDPVGRGMAPFRRLLTRNGRMLCMALGGPRDVAYILASVVFGSRRVRFVQSPPTLDLLSALAGLVESGLLKPVIDSTYSLEDIGAAHRSLEQPGGFGKRIVRLT